MSINEIYVFTSIKKKDTGFDFEFNTSIQFFSVLVLNYITGIQFFPVLVLTLIPYPFFSVSFLITVSVSVLKRLISVSEIGFKNGFKSC